MRRTTHYELMKNILLADIRHTIVWISAMFIVVPKCRLRLGTGDRWAENRFPKGAYWTFSFTFLRTKTGQGNHQTPMYGYFSA